MNPFSIVLVRSHGAFNIGATARAMQNMGVDRLILVNPQTEIDVRAREGAASAQAILARRIIYSHMQEFYEHEGDGLRLAFTRRDGVKRASYNFTQYLREEFVPKFANEYQGKPIYLIFGSEDDGLSTSELEFVHRCVTLPTYGEHGSLNLAQAVLLALFVLASELAQHGHASAIESGRALDIAPMEYPKPLVNEWLTTLGLSFDSNQRRNASEIVNNLLLRAVPNPEELRILSGLLHQTIRKLRDRRQNGDAQL